MSDGNANNDNGFQTLQLSLLVADLILTSIVTVVTTMRFRAKCGDVECACKPKESARSPGSVTSPASPASSTLPGQQQGGRAMAIVIDSPPQENTKK